MAIVGPARNDVREMTPCISQLTTLGASFEADLDAYAHAGWVAFEIWLTKLEQAIERAGLKSVRLALANSGLKPKAAAVQGGVFTAEGPAHAAHWDHFRQRLDLLASLEVPILVIVPDFLPGTQQIDVGRVAANLAEAAEAAAVRGITLALEFQKSVPFCTSLDTAIALVEHCGAKNLGVCLDLFHYYTGPSKFEDLAYLGNHNLAHVQVCDLSGTPRELAADSDRILPGDGDFQLVPIFRRLKQIGYTGAVSVEAANPNLWRIPPDRVAEVASQALSRVLEQTETDPSETGGV